ncbi:LacI family DNA-binding transcriptional regulator, partial [Micromonospora echinofusca]
MNIGADEVPATIRDVAARAGVALSSVSRVLSGHPDVSAAMRSRVESAAKDLG